MRSIRTSRRFHGAPISLAALVRLEQRNFPVRLSELLQVAHRPFQGHIEVGDVNCDWDMSLFSNGFWKVRATLHDEGAVAGDFYLLEFLLDEARGIGAKFDGILGSQTWGGSSKEHSEEGSDPWIRDHWGAVMQRGISTHLRATPNVGAIISTVGIALVTFGGILFFTSPGKTEAGPCENDPFGEHEPCVRFHKVP